MNVVSCVVERLDQFDQEPSVSSNGQAPDIFEYKGPSTQASNEVYEVAGEAIARIV